MEKAREAASEIEDQGIRERFMSLIDRLAALELAISELKRKIDEIGA